MDASKIFGTRVFNEQVMRQCLPREVYESLKSTNRAGKPLDPEIAEIVAGAMKDWAVEQGATHYTHWFQPMTGVTAGKHDAFLDPMPDGTAIQQFSAKALVQGEPDASSFPNGGIRATFEARGYTAWDPTSPAFVRDGTLYIPTAFCSHGGEALDAKTPLLRSMETVSVQAMRIIRLFGNTTSSRVVPTVGAEQEYFLVDRERYERRLDLKLCGRTLIGARPPKGQELDDHYCGRIRLRVAEFMKDLDRQLWELGVPSKTKHNEAAPAQHELAPMFASANIAADQNQLVMEMLRIVAKKHGLACLLHEKPFDGVNGSGKHDNWALSTDDGINLLNPGKTPYENAQFLIFLCAVIQAVHLYGDLFRLSSATPGNDRRLGGYEAPPAVISIYLGEQLTGVLHDIAGGYAHSEEASRTLLDDLAVLPTLPRESSDRNRTSPIAFTGNKFEFRMVGSSQSISFANVVFNTAVADALEGFAGRMEQAKDFDKEVQSIVSDTMRDHGSVLYNGNNYTAAWVEEARRRGLPVLPDTLSALEHFLDPKNVDLFQRRRVFSGVEMHARYEIMLENYSKVLTIEAATLLEMVRRELFPAVVSYAGKTASAFNSLYAAGLCPEQVKQHLEELSGLANRMGQETENLSALLEKASHIEDSWEHGLFMRDEILPAMEELRRCCDRAETITDRSVWPIPTYTDLLHRV
ncbi:MAG: glutamine synthetase III [Oscillospiraceae bacterium]|nr:glutamine synthetase III [Oscillospiraceae bacterium]